MTDWFASHADNPAYSEKVSERLKTVAVVAHKNVDTIKERIGRERWNAYYREAEALLTSQDPLWIKLRILYRIADELSEFVKPDAACRRGCSHCCHVGVAVFEPEARMLGMAIHRKPKTKTWRKDFEYFKYGYHNPCTFLKGGECSIYQHRPLACRILLNVDVDALLCELIPPHSVPVPYFNLTHLMGIYVRLCLKSKKADIRDYFPP